MNADHIATIDKNDQEQIRISLLKTNKVDIRTYFAFPDSKEHKPTRKGVMLLPKHTHPILSAMDKFAKNGDENIHLEFFLSVKEKLRAYTSEYRNKKLFHIRVFYNKEGEFKPGKGISFPVTLAPKIHAALKTAGVKQKAA